MGDPTFGAGIWHFAAYVDRYATDGCGAPVTLPESIDRAGSVGDLSYVDLTYPFADQGLTLDDVKAALRRNGQPVAARHAVNRTSVKPGQSVAVFGAGPIGLGAVIGYKLRGAASVAVVDVIPSRLEKALARLQGLREVPHRSRTGIQ